MKKKWFKIVFLAHLSVLAKKFNWWNTIAAENVIGALNLVELVCGARNIRFLDSHRLGTVWCAVVEIKNKMNYVERKKRYYNTIDDVL